MKTKNIREIKGIFILLVFIALSAAMTGCGSGSNTANNTAATPNVNRDTPSNTAATQTPTPNPAEGILGVWETRDPRVVKNITTMPQPDFVRLKINYGTEDKGNYNGDVTDVTTNANVGRYTLYPNKSVKLDLAPLIQGTFDYDVAPDGNTLSLKTDSNPIVFRRGSANTDVEKDARTLSDPAISWVPTPSTKTSILDRTKYDVNFVTFDSPSASGEGYGGKMILQLPGPTKEGTYIIAPNKKIIFDIGSGRTEGNYSLESNGDLLRIKFQDGTEWIFNK